MLYHLFQYLEQQDYIGAGLFQYITFRAGMAVILSLIITLVLGGRLIKVIQNFQVIEKQRILGLPGEALKAKTPTMGGIMIIMGIVIPSLLFARLDNIYIQLMLFTTIWLGLVGFLDDYLKLTKGKEGLAGRYKILGQIIVGLVIALAMLFHDDIVVRMTADQLAKGNYEIIKSFIDQSTQIEYYYVKTTLTNIPFIKAFNGNEFDYTQMLWFLGDNAPSMVWAVFVPFVIIVVTAVSNAANLTDGMDGLAIGVSAIILAALAILAYVSGNTIFADYLGILYLPNTGELSVFIACTLGACLGFLWYNANPAQVFMGDTGSLAMGGIIAALAIFIRKEFLIPILCGIFVVENLSVIIQVGYFKYTKKKYGEGRRVFLMSPLHHHYQKKGIPESRLVTRFWIIGIILAVLTIITLKVR
ncbi:MAG: phospho-N-acetylmuramoyl-pentapeptide-transferase [Saprospiraceae bacterium]